MPNIEYIAFAIFCLMIVQHVLIVRVTRQTSTFHHAWRQYRNHIAICNTLAAVVLIVAVVLILVDANYVARHNQDNPIITKKLLQIINTKGFLSLTVLALFLASIKIMIERYFERQLREKYPDIQDPWQKDVWLLWFVASVIITLPLEYRVDVDIDPPYQVIHYVGATVIVAIVLLTYVSWIHNALYRQMSETSGLIGSIIPTLHRKLLPLDSHPPAQALVIGPKEAGKSELVKNCDPVYKEESEKRDEHLGSQIIETATMIQTMNVPGLGSSKQEEVRFALLDFPGENIGDHCTLPFDLRCDVLVLVMPEEAFNPRLTSVPTLIE